MESTRTEPPAVSTAAAAPVSPPSKSSKNKSGWGRFVKGVKKSMMDGAEARRAAKEAKEAGEIWNAETKEWVFYFIDQELEQVEQELEIANKKNKTDENNNGTPDEGERPVADREYYDLLGVSTNADDATIRKAYFKAARKCHPDKNPNDPDAHANFQKLGHAYQVLSKPETRAAYDKNGKPENGSPEDQMMDEVDPFVFFNVMFGSALVEPYIGELGIATTLDSVMKSTTADDMEALEAMPEEERNAILQAQAQAMEEKSILQQRARELKCAQNLRKRIADYDEKNPEPFVQSAREEAIEIANGAYGALYLTTIGFCLAVAADEFLGFEKSFLGLSGHVARSRKNASNINSGFKIVGSVVRAAGAGSRAMAEAEKLQQEVVRREETGQEQIDDQAAQEMMAETIDGSLPVFLELAWAFNKRDIQMTLHEVCKKLFQDATVPKEMRLIRAKAVRKLGREFRDVGKSFKAKAKENFHAEDIKARVAVATMATMAKAQGQEVTEQDQEEMIRQAKQMSFEDNAGSTHSGGEAESTTDGKNAAPGEEASAMDAEAKKKTEEAVKEPAKVVKPAGGDSTEESHDLD